MNDTLGALSLALLAVPGIALLICVRLLFGRKPNAAPSSAALALTIAGRVMLVVALIGLIFGSMGPGAVVILPIGIIVIFMAIDRRRRLEHQALLVSLAVAAEKGIPLTEVSLAFADELGASSGRRSLWLANALHQGATLDAALSYAWIKCSTAVRMGVRIGASLGVLGPAIRRELDAADELESVMRPMLTRWIYLFSVVVIGQHIATFIMIWIVPVFDKMFQEFGLELPATTVLLINMSRWTVHGGWLFLTPFFLLGMAIYFMGIFSYIGWLPRSMPPLNRLFRRYDGAIVLRSLGLAVRRGQSLADALRLIADMYPLGTVRRWLARASRTVDGGGDWCDALRQVRLIDRTDVVVLKAAERAGNLPWALDEMAESLQRREIHRWQAWYNIVMPILVLILGTGVGYFCIALFLPLVTMVTALAQ